MKNLVILLGMTLLLCGGCKYFRKQAPQNTEIITADTVSSEEGIDSSAYYNTMPDQGNAGNEVAVTSVPGNAVSGNYYMIVGCFTVSTNADSYAEKIRGMGYAVQIIQKNNFRMVSAKAYNNYGESVGELAKFRNDVTPNAWIYRER